jgi:hypothetical protein
MHCGNQQENEISLLQIETDSNSKTLGETRRRGETARERERERERERN